MEGKAKRPLLTETGINYSLAGVLPVLLTFLAVTIFRAAAGENYESYDSYKYLCYLLPQLCFAAACLLFFRRSGELSAREVYSPCKWYYFLIALALAFGLLSLSELNDLFIGLLEKVGYKRPQSTLPTLSGWYLLPAMIVIALLPAIFEESVFRGIQVRAMQKSGWGLASTLLISGALFSLFHGNPAQTLYQFACGAAYGLLAVRSGSVFPTMLAHFSNNAVILALVSAGLDEIPGNAKLPLYLVAAVVLAATLVFLLFFERRGNQRGKPAGGTKFFLAASVGIAICAVEWITALVQGIS